MIKLAEKYKHMAVLLIKWLMYGAIIGVVVGSTTALLLTTNDFLGQVR
jgi:H+/Cl- antiporter ClcA